MLMWGGAGERGSFLSNAHVVEGLVCSGTVLGVGAGRSCPIIGVGLGNLTGWVAEDKLEGGLGTCL